MVRVREGKIDHRVGWNQACKPKKEVRLSIKRISFRNRALVGKWLWGFLRDSDGLWHNDILNISGSNSNRWDANCVVSWSHKYPWNVIVFHG